MGGSQSKAQGIVDVVNTAITNVLINSSATCAGPSATNSQTISYNNINAPGCELDFSNINQTGKITTNFTCATDQANAAKLQNDFKTELDNQVSATSDQALGYSSSDSTAITKAKNDIENNINMSQISQCVAGSVNNNQSYSVSNIYAPCTESQIANGTNKINGSNIVQKFVANLVATCTAKQSAITDIANTLATKITQKSAAHNELFDTSALIAIAVIIGMILLLVIIFKFL